MVGHETIANSVGFTLYALACNPDIQQRLRDEILSAEDLSYENIQKLDYLDAVMKEGYENSPHAAKIPRRKEASLPITVLILDVIVSEYILLRPIPSASISRTT